MSAFCIARRSKVPISSNNDAASNANNRCNLLLDLGALARGEILILTGARTVAATVKANQIIHNPRPNLERHWPRGSIPAGETRHGTA